MSLWNILRRKRSSEIWVRHNINLFMNVAGAITKERE